MSGGRVQQKPPIVLPLGEGEELVFRHIPAGTFRMGARGYEANEEPVTEVFVEEFWMGETPVTRGQYRILAEWAEKKLQKVEGFAGGEPNSIETEEDARRSVTEVNWHEAIGVGSELTRRMGDFEALRDLRDDFVINLPTEAQWERACRAGTETEYSAGDGAIALEEVGYFGRDRDSGPFPVKGKSPNCWDLWDCHGNVLEWCQSEWESGATRLLVPSEGGIEREGEGRVLRCGAWLNFARVCRSAFRDWDWPGIRARFYGFRLAVVPSPTFAEASAGKPSS